MKKGNNYLRCQFFATSNLMVMNLSLQRTAKNLKNEMRSFSKKTFYNIIQIIFLIHLVTEQALHHLHGEINQDDDQTH